MLVNTVIVHCFSIPVMCVCASVCMGVKEGEIKIVKNNLFLQEMATSASGNCILCLVTFAPSAIQR